MDQVDVMAILFGLLFIISEVRAYCDQKIIKKYREMVDSYSDINSKWISLYEDAKDLSMDLLREHQPDDYEECIQRLSELHTKAIMKRNARK